MVSILLLDPPPQTDSDIEFIFGFLNLITLIMKYLHVVR